MKQNNCKVIGITGGIASGKTSLTKVLIEKGFKVIDADKIARDIIESGEVAYYEIVESFGEKILNKDRTINRKALGKEVFSNKKLLKKLNRITHPKIYERIKEDLILLCKDSNMVFIDIPLLFEEKKRIDEEGIYFDQIWLVYLEEDLQLERLQKRNKLGREEALRRIRHQIPLRKKKYFADKIIDNSGSILDLKSQVENILEDILL